METTDPRATLDSLSGGSAASPGAPPSFSPAFLIHYAYVRTLGEGSMGTVHLFRQIKLDRLVAVKVVKGDEITGDQIRRLLKEARILAGLNHPSILAVYDVEEGEGVSPYLVSEYVEGSTLAQRLRRMPPPDLEEVLSFGIAVLDALVVAHGREVVHRDLKPDNIFLTSDGRPKIGDFGLAKARFLPSGVSVGQIAGTPAYMSPEQCLGESTTPSSDIYSMGVILYEMATGRTPFLGPRLVDYLTQHVNQEPPALRSFRAEVPEAFEKVILRAMAKDPASRYPSAVAFQQALLDLAGATGIHRSVGTRSLGGLRPRGDGTTVTPVTSLTPAAGTPGTVAASASVLAAAGQSVSTGPVAGSIGPVTPATHGRWMPVAGVVMGALALAVSLMERSSPAPVAIVQSVPPPAVELSVAPVVVPSVPALAWSATAGSTRASTAPSAGGDPDPGSKSPVIEVTDGARGSGVTKVSSPRPPVRRRDDEPRPKKTAALAVDPAPPESASPRSPAGGIPQPPPGAAAHAALPSSGTMDAVNGSVATDPRAARPRPSSPPESRPPPILGTWKWDVKALVKFACRVTIEPDGTVDLVGGPGGMITNRGTWILADAVERKVVVTWRNGSYDTLTLSSDGKRLDGRNSLGLRVNATRAD